MNRFLKYIFILISITPMSLRSQNLTQSDNYPFSVFLNGGYSYTNFDIPTQLNYYGELGLTYHLSNHIFVYTSLNSQNFYKPNNTNSPMQNFYTQLVGADIGALYEITLDPVHSIGIGSALNVNLYSARGTEKDGRVINTNGYIDRPIYNYKFIFLFRKDINDGFDFQCGLTYNVLQSYYADLYEDLSKASLDTYVNIFGGVVYYVGSGYVHSIFKHSKKVGCPKF